MQTETESINAGHGIAFHPAQVAYIQCPSHIKAYVGGRGAGKSFVGAYEFWRNLKPDRLYAICTPDYATIKDATLRSFTNFLDLVGRYHRIKLSDFRGEVETPLGGLARVVFRVGDKADKARGPNLSGAWYDEASLMIEGFRNNMLACLREDPNFNFEHFTFTPKGMSHWTTRLFTEMHPESLFHSTSAGNFFLPEVFVDRVRENLTGEMARQELDGEFVDMEGQLITPEMFALCTDKDCFKLIATGDRFVGIDIGRTKNPTAIYVIDRLFNRALGTYQYIVRENIVLKNISYKGQYARIVDTIDNWKPLRVGMDQGGIGHQLCEDLQTKYGKGKVIAYNMSRPEMGRLGTQLATKMEQAILRIPDDEELRLDFSLVGSPQPQNGKNILKAEDVKEDKEGRHGDQFWACAIALDLACHQVNGFSGVLPVISKGRVS